MKLKTLILPILVGAYLIIAPKITYAATCTSAATGDWTNNSTWAAGCTSGGPIAGDTVSIGAHTVTIRTAAGAVAAGSVTFTSTGTLAIESTASLTISGALTLNSSASGNTTAAISGAGSLTAGSVVVGTAVTPTGARTTILTSTLSSLTVSGGVTLTGSNGSNVNRHSDATLNLQSGAMSVAGTVALNPSTNGPAVFSLNSGASSATLTLSNSTPFSGTGTFTANGASATVIYSGSNPTLNVVSYTNLTINGSGTASGAVTTVTGDLVVGGSITWTNSAISSTPSSITTSGTASFTTGANTTVGSGGLTIGTNTTLTMCASCTLSVTGNTSISGLFANPNTANSKTFSGSVTVTSGGSITNAGNSTFFFQNGFSNDGTVSLGSGNVNFSTNNQAIGGSQPITFGGSVNLSGGVSVTNNNSSTVTIIGALNGTSSPIWQQGSGSYLVLSNNGATFATSGSLDASTNPSNTVEYSGGSSTVIYSTTYGNLTVSGTLSTGTQTATIVGAFTVSSTFTPSGGTITMDNGSSIDNSGTLTFNALTIASGATVSVTSGTFTVGGTFTANSGSTINYTSTSNQTIPGLNYVNLGVGTSANSTATTYTLGGNTAVSGILTVGNSGSTAVDVLDGSTRTLNLTGSGTVFSIDPNWGSFSASTSTVQYTGTTSQNIAPTSYYGLEVTTSSPRTVTFTSGSTYSVATNGHLTFTGVASNLLTLAPSAATAWNLHVSSTNTTVTVQYVSVSYSNATSFKNIDATGGTNTDGGNNSNWTFSNTATNVSITKLNANTMTAGSCNNSGDYAFTVQLTDSGNVPKNPSQTTIVRLTTNSGGILTVFSTAGSSSCSSTYSNGDVTFNTSTNTITVYVSDTKKSATNWTLTADDVSGDPLTLDTENYSIAPGAVSQLVITLPGQSFVDGAGNSSTPSNQTAGTSFNITKVSATDSYFNINSSDTTYDNDTRTLVFSGPANGPDSTPPSYTTAVHFVNGQSTTTLATTLYKAETTTLTVTDSGQYGLASSSVTVNPGNISAASTDSSVSLPGPTGTSNTPYTVTITLKDTWKNPIPSVAAANISIGATLNSSITQPSVATDSNGQTTGVVTWINTGNKTVDITITGASLVQNDGITADLDGKLDGVATIIISTPGVTAQFGSGIKIKSGTKIRTN